MARLDRRWTLAISALLVLAITPSRASAREAGPPNIIVVLADDLGQGDVGSYNPHSAIPTPYLDRIAREGMRFVDMHSPSSVCTPTRYGLLTGRYAWRTRLKRGVLFGYDPNLIEPGRLTLPALLKRAGYSTAAIGKWHLGLGAGPRTDYARPLRPGPLDMGFDSFFGVPASLDMTPYVYIEGDRVERAASTETPGSDAPRGVFFRAGAMAPGFEMAQVLPRLSDRAASYVRAQKGAKRPYFLYLALPSPHMPWVPLPEFRGRSRAGLYGDFVSQTDAAIGRLVQAIEETGQKNRTLLIVTSDNGADWSIEDRQLYAHQANLAWRGRKADIHEAGHRVPFLVRWPGVVRAGTVSAEMGSLVDLMATVAGIVAQPLPNDAAEDSFDLLPAWKQRNRRPIRSDMVMHSLTGMFAIREERWKLALGLGSGGFTLPVKADPAADGPKGQLFDLRSDPMELRNLYDARPDLVRRLSALLERQQAAGRSRPLTR